MSRFTDDELILISLYDPGSRKGAISELNAMTEWLLPDETELKALAGSALEKLAAMRDEDFDEITKDLLLNMPLDLSGYPHLHIQVPSGFHDGSGPVDVHTAEEG